VAEQSQAARDAVRCRRTRGRRQEHGGQQEGSPRTRRTWRPRITAARCLEAATRVRLWLMALRLDAGRDGARLLTANGSAGGPRVLLEGGRLARCARRLGHAAAGMRMLAEAAAGEALAGGVLWG
jgi:hypothetical protein